jgi:ubiquinone/menaquinone biosynthesis C-methylase UbiE
MTDHKDILKKNYPIIDGIIRTIDGKEITGRNKRYQALYDSFAPYYTPIQKVVEFFFTLFKKNRVNPINQFLDGLGIKPGDKVLEVSIGSGDNVTALHKDIDLYGLDISLGMLKQCLKRHSKKQHITLIHGMAEDLPFNDEVFDAVFHVGGINFFNDRAKAIKEMIRVAKPGTRFVIADETEKAAKAGEKMPIARRFFKNRDEEIVPPVDLIPKEMLDIKLQYLLSNDELYVITFTKPK